MKQEARTHAENRKGHLLARKKSLEIGRNDQEVAGNQKN